MRIAGTVVACVLSVTLLSACGKNRSVCRQDDKDYVGAREMPPLQAPPGLDAPNTRNALRVPPLTTPERPRAKTDACLDAPPPFETPRVEPQKTPDAQAPK